MPGPRVQVRTIGPMHLVLVDSTGGHNRRIYCGHGRLTAEDCRNIGDALRDAPRDSFRVVAMHHHPLPLPEELLCERVASWLWLPFATELPQGETLLQQIWTRCDLVLHGHRHLASARRFAVTGAHPIDVLNAGSSAELGRARIFTHQGGSLRDPPTWITLAPPRSQIVRAGQVRTGSASTWSAA
jgi:3',5'-cyclic AMP phosphodiesterase CpdA